MTRNGSLSSSIQKAFMKATPGCIEHQCKLAAILAEARKNHKSLALCWLDPANAYGSVHHSLIQFSISHYHAPPQFCSIIQSLYSDLSGTVVTNDWSTATIPLELGVYQGDPLSVVIFNTWLTPCRPDQTLVSFSPTLTTRSTSCNMQMTPASRPTAQLLVSVSWTWLTGGSNGQVRMRAKVPKCHCLALQDSTGKLYDPHLSITNQIIPFIGSNSIKFQLICQAQRGS